MTDSPIVYEWMKPLHKNFLGLVKDYYIEFIEKYLLKEEDRYILEFYNGGYVSAVAKVSIMDKRNSIETTIFKSSYKNDLILAQIKVLKEYERYGYKVSTVKGNYMGKYVIQFLDFIDCPLLSNKYSTLDRVNSGISFKMGELLSKMHKDGYVGYGNLDLEFNNIKGKFSSLVEHLENDVLIQRAGEMVRIGFFDKDFITSLNKGIQELKDSEKTLKPVLINLDFSPNNIFINNDELIVFDPKPKISHPYIDLSHTIVNSFIYDDNHGWVEGREILRGYISNNGLVDWKLLKNALNLMTVYKAQSIYRKGYLERAKLAKKALDVKDLDLM